MHYSPCASLLGLLCGLCLCCFSHSFVVDNVLYRRRAEPIPTDCVIPLVAPQGQQQQQQQRTSSHLRNMKRPFLDQLASTLFRLENNRVEQSSVVDDMGRKGEPMEWSDDDSFANRFSQLVGGNGLGYQFKQWVADIIAGSDFDRETVLKTIDTFVQDNPVAMFSFTTCPFCRRAKDYLDEVGIPYQSMELDELEGNAGNEIRSILGRKTGRTSVPSIFIGGTYIGGCNDGPGLLPLAKSGELDELLKAAGISPS